MKKTLVLLKPDAIQRGLVGEIVSRLERRGLKLAATKMMWVSRELATQLYAVHVGKPFFDGLVDFITSSPIIAMVVEGEEAVELVRTTMGATDPGGATPGTIRGDLAVSISRNLIHGSDSEETARGRSSYSSTPEELLDYPRDSDRWITES